MHLYSLTLQPPGAVTAAVFGNFSAPRQQEVVVAKGHVLELLRPDETGKLHTILSRDAFGVVRTLLSFRLFGGDRDFLVVGSDSGRIAFLEFQPERGDFVQVHLEVLRQVRLPAIDPWPVPGFGPEGSCRDDRGYREAEARVRDEPNAHREADDQLAARGAQEPRDRV